MKRLVPFVLFAIIILTPALGQPPVNGAEPDSISQQSRHSGDENGDGIDDSHDQKGKRLQRGKARFVDKDGDGICDGRESGLSFRGGRATGAGGKVHGRQWRGGNK